jgi:heterodisulfide reductase subunit A-like polyferredoxin
MIHHNLKKRHNMTPEEYAKKAELQFNGCAICKQPCKTGRNLAIDHDHKTNVVRDLLCQRCNVVLGLVNDDESLLFDMMDYLKRHQVRIAS